MCMEHNKPIFVISGPSGVGKDSVIREIEKNNPKYQKMITCTSRPKHENEMDGREYFFLSKNEFENYIKQNKFIEWTVTHGNYYGPLKSELDKMIDTGKIPLMPADVDGLLNFKKQYEVT